MTWHSLAVCGLYIVLLLVLAVPLGRLFARAMAGELGLLRPLERALCRLGGVQDGEEMTWSRYALAALAFNFIGLLVVFLLLRWQGELPLNPMGLGAVAPDLAFNTAVSFASNTNWQAYGGETTLSYLTQMLGLTVQNFVSAATGIAVLVALVRGLARRTASPGSATSGST
jgi:K+-transporting ATPase ATPase A chain